jgi:protein phosphatase
MRFAAGNAQNIGARSEQQDAFGFSDLSDRKFLGHGGFLGVVADGMGGLAKGSDASRGAVQAFLAAYTRKTAQESIPDALTRSLQEANNEVLRLASAASAEELGTTLVAAVLQDGMLHWISVGDSRIYLLHGSELIQLTTDHIYAKELNAKVAAGRISLEEAQSHPERASLTSYLGQTELKEVDRNARPLAIDAEDCVLLCSDGLYRALSEQEIVAAFREELQPACDSLVAQVVAKRRKQQDNLTVIALKAASKSRGGEVGFPGDLRPLAVMLVTLVVGSLSAGVGYWFGAAPTNGATTERMSRLPHPDHSIQNTAPAKQATPTLPTDGPPKPQNSAAPSTSASAAPSSASKKGTPNKPGQDSEPDVIKRTFDAGVGSAPPAAKLPAKNDNPADATQSPRDQPSAAGPAPGAQPNGKSGQDKTPDKTTPESSPAGSPPPANPSSTPATPPDQEKEPGVNQSRDVPQTPRGVPS